MLRDHDLSAALVEVGDDVVAVEGLVRDQGAELDALDQRASVRARILVVMPPLDLPMAWLPVPLLRLVRGGGL
jgi:hypothetical protein